MTVSSGDAPRYEVVRVSGQTARVQIYHERAIVFQAIPKEGQIKKDGDLRFLFRTGSDIDGRIDSAIQNQARKMARIAINKVRRKQRSKRRKH